MIKGFTLRSAAIILTGAILLLASPAQALTRSADKECLLCHVLWFDAFKTDQKTLVPEQASAVVVDGSTGLVSTEAMCVTCHDGYVADSRVVVEKKNPHHDLKQPPKSMNLPKILRLDSNNEIYCGTCHTLHDFEGSAQVGSTPFMRMNNESSQMCIACHGDKSGQQTGVNHPVLKKIDEQRRLAVTARGGQFGPRQEMTCQSCHKAHGQRALVTVPDNTTLCLGCHQKQAGLLSSKHDLRKRFPGVKNIKQKTPAASGPCGTCHVPHNAAGGKLWARPLKKGTPATQMCLSCHGEGSGLDIKGIGTHSHPVNAKPASGQARPGNLPLFMATAKRSETGNVQCASCHNAHQWDPATPENIGKSDTEGDASNSFLRIANDADSTLCIGCHQDKKQLTVSDHNLKLTAPEARNNRQRTAEDTGPCGACHVPHNAAGRKIWARPLEPGPAAEQMCLSCHAEGANVPGKRIGKYSHPVNVRPANKDRVPANLPLFAADAARTAAGQVQCFSCHDPHRWDPTAETVEWEENKEGDSSNSFLRMSNHGDSAMCVACHGDKKQVLASDHNLTVTAPLEKNIASMTATQSGPCSACHVPHNAADKRLWAKALTGDKDWVSDLCVGCHRDAGAAKLKKIGDHDHPVGVSLASARISAKMDDIVRKLPLYDPEGTRKNAERMVCLTCHDPHVWRPKRDGNALVPYTANIEGDVATSFLRMANDPASSLCKTCHIDRSKVEGTVHDLNISAPNATNIAGQTVASSGTCGSCHMVHNSPHAVGLWARNFGPLAKDVNPVGALCTSCHSKGNLAEKKIPGVASHPAGKLMRRHEGGGRGKIGFTPVFDGKGRRQGVGTIGCPSCHDGHMGRPATRNSGDGTTADTALKVNARFLRNRSFNTICMECHGPEGLFRYLYFHDPDKRGIWVRPRQAHDRSTIRTK